MVVRPLIIHELKIDDGRVYKTIGTDAEPTYQESLKTKLWMARLRGVI